MTHFTPVPALLGGALIGASASVLLLLTGRVAGISGIVSGLLLPKRGETSWRIWFVVGLLSGGLILRWVHPAAFGTAAASMPMAALAGLLVGVGTRLSGGCTSGHGVCGVSRLSTRSLAATAVFLCTGILTASLVQHDATRVSVGAGSLSDPALPARSADDRHALQAPRDALAPRVRSSARRELVATGESR